jgi:tetratricopeptide (TPR) repeat protein
VLGDENPRLITPLNNLGSRLRRLERLDEAAQVFGEALALGRRALGEDHPKLAVTLNNLGGVLQQRGRYAEALDHFSKALAIVRRETPDHERVFFLELRVQEMRLELGELEAAVAVLRPALERWRPLLVEDRPDWIARGAGDLGEALRRLGRFAAAEPLLIESFETLSRRPDPQRTLAAERLAALYRDWGRPQQAAEYLARAEAPRR